MKDMAALNADPTAKGREDHKAEMARMARATIELQLELNDATPERRRLFGRTEDEGACMATSQSHELASVSCAPCARLRDALQMGATLHHRLETMASVVTLWRLPCLFVAESNR